MDDIARLLSGSDVDEPGGLFPWDDPHAGGPRARDIPWCQTQPDQAAIRWLAVALGARRGLRKGAR